MSITQHNFNDDGHEKNSKSIGEQNRLKINSLSLEEIKNGQIGYKAARTKDNKFCVIKLLIPKDAKVAWDVHRDKYRTDKAIVLSIKPVIYDKKNYYYVADFKLEECPICLDDKATFLALPCRHKLCGNCWKALIEKNMNKLCHYCKTEVAKVEELPISKTINNELQLENEESYSLEEAYSCVHTNDFAYRINEEVQIVNFDADLKKVCAPGIHYHAEEKDIFQWFEYLDIPEELVYEKIPWNSDQKEVKPINIVEMANKEINEENDENIPFIPAPKNKKKGKKKKGEVSVPENNNDEILD